MSLRMICEIVKSSFAAMAASCCLSSDGIRMPTLDILLHFLSAIGYAAVALQGDKAAGA